MRAFTRACFAAGPCLVLGHMFFAWTCLLDWWALVDDGDFSLPQFKGRRIGPIISVQSRRCNDIRILASPAAGHSLRL